MDPQTNNETNNPLPPIDPSLKTKSVETYAADMANELLNNKEGLIKKVIHEQEERESEKDTLSPEFRRNKIFMRISVVLLVLSLVMLGLIYFNRETIQTVSVKPQFVPLVYTDSTAFKDVTGLVRDQIIQTVLNQVSETKVKAGGIEGVYLTENKDVMGLKRFMRMIKGTLLLDAKTSISDTFLIGIANNQSRDLFVLLKARSFEDVFPEMKAWEAKMFAEIAPLYGFNLNANSNYLLTKPFENSFIQNKNARILYDTDKNIVLMYVYLDDTTIIITRSENAVKEVLLRLSTTEIRK